MGNPLGMCQYADLIEFCDRPAEQVLELAAEWGGHTPVCKQHAEALTNHIKNN